MSATLLDFPVVKTPAPEPSPRDLMLRALEPHILIGMPHLDATGLSETWLMKELGHRHWLMLALHLGLDNADFRTADGGEAYAAICASSLSAARLDSVRANDILTLRSQLSPVSRTQTATRHRLSIGDIAIGEVELVSTFVARQVEGDNHSIVRMPIYGDGRRGIEPSTLAGQAAAARSGRLETHLGLSLAADHALRSFSFRPSVSQEFNGAGLFYFAQFQAIAERAVETWFPQPRPIVRRDIFFLGNIDPGQSVIFDLTDMSEDGLAACGALRIENGKTIARIVWRWKQG